MNQKEGDIERKLRILKHAAWTCNGLVPVT